LLPSEASRPLMLCAMTAPWRRGLDPLEALFKSRTAKSASRRSRLFSAFCLAAVIQAGGLPRRFFCPRARTSRAAIASEIWRRFRFKSAIISFKSISPGYRNDWTRVADGDGPPGRMAPAPCICTGDLVQRSSFPATGSAPGSQIQRISELRADRLHLGGESKWPGSPVSGRVE